MRESGILYVVATPIGNLEDITLRALRILKEVDIIAAEDTRKTLKLLNYYKIKANLLSYREENKIRQGKRLITYLKSGKNIALVTDAGTPGISDPGVHLVHLALKEDIKVTPIPGPSALTCALSVAGLPIQPFIFMGFLPQRAARRRKLLANLKEQPYAIVFYESPHRIKKTLKDMADIFKEREVAIIREMTKVHEEIILGLAEDILKDLEQREIKGEITVIISRAIKGDEA
ncbi:MAG: 16S rRNA (cytidine(1402)-2'-O)-methyltransferase [Deltaproteobacteria bacterium]|nr:16S rRNA (cytidine(1402)-2'-O)-methyltransferase [Deltaproteobacteria bacterium]